MTPDHIILGLILVAFAVFGVSLFAVSIYARSTPQPKTRAVTRAERPKSDRAHGYRRAF